MGKKIFVFLVMLVGFSILLPAQDKNVDARVKLAREKYPERLEHIKMVRQYEADEIPNINYLTTIRKQNWAGSGQSTDKMEFFYHEIEDEEGYEPQPVGYTLVMARRNFNVSDRKFLEEYVYDDDGNPLFWFARYDSIYGGQVELRGYFDADGTLLRTLTKNADKEGDVNPAFEMAGKNFSQFRLAFQALYGVEYSL